MTKVVITGFGYCIGNNKQYKEINKNNFSKDKILVNTVNKDTKYNYSLEEQIAFKAVDNTIKNIPFGYSTYIGLCVSSTMNNLEKLNKSNYSSKDILSLMNNNIAIKLKEEYDLDNNIHYISSACSGGAESIIRGYEQILLGNNSAMLCGGVDVYNDLLGTLFYRNNLLSKKGICKPFCNDRDGTILSEGAAFLLLENKEQAIKRNANIYGEIVAVSSFTDKGYTASVNSIKNTIIKACNKINIEDIDLYNAHATGTVKGDYIEETAINELDITSRRVAYKSIYGHTLSASAPLEIIHSLKYDTFNTMLKFSSGLGNTNAAIIIRR